MASLLNSPPPHSPPRLVRAFPAGFPLEVMPVPVQRDADLHAHDFSELVIVLRGSGVHRSPAGDHRLDAGDVFVLHGSQAHGYRDTDGLGIMNILFRMDELPIALQDLVALPGYHALFTLEPFFRERDRFAARLRLSPDRLRRASELLDRLIREWCDRPPGWHFAATAALMLLMSDLCRWYSGMQEDAARPVLDLARVMGHIEANYADPLTLDDLAAVGAMSRRTLTRQFRRALGCSPVEYLLRLRLERAAALLRDSDLPVTDVALRTGFTDSNYLARLCRARLGCRPTDLRSPR